MINLNGTPEKKKRVMIVDDSQLNCELITEILGESYDYVYAGDGVSALDLLSAAEQIDIVLLDMNMPNMGGMEFLKVMSSRRWTEEIPVVIISAESDISFIQNAYSLGAVDYIVRPFNAFLVKHRVENTLLQYSQKKRLANLVGTEIYKRESVNNVLINIFSNLVEMRNSESGGHTLHVQIITKLLLKKLVEITDKYSLSDEEIVTISTASALHDIGKSLIPAEILNKPGKLTDSEWQIMKSHTVKGDEFLQNVYADDSANFITVAREICRYHHERYDGGGYPDGLSGDDIPVSAQVVAVADVYDALTSDRCYKSAYSHEQAVSMILNGECGSFNPLILQCFTGVADDLLLHLKGNFENPAEINTDVALKRELLFNEEIRVDERLYRLAEYEAAKKEFFATQCSGIQFEYDAERRKVSYMKYYNSNGEQISLPAEATRLLNDDDLNELRAAINELTPENPVIIKIVLVPINGDMRWHKLSVRGIFGKNGGHYKYIVGQFIDIQDKLLAESNGILVKGESLSGDAILAMRKLFEVVRLVDPSTCQVLKIDKDGDIFDTGEKCYGFWNRGEACKNCSSAKAFENKHWTSKLEVKNGRMYSVVSRRVSYKGKDCVLELAFNMNESIEKSQDAVGYTALDSSVLKSYYLDSVTKIFSRAYLENFRSGFETAKGVAVIDVDKFKAVNDNYGHVVGDAVLRHVAKIVSGCIRKEDVIVRYGGDEFLLVFFNISEEDFYEKLRVIKNAVKESYIDKYPEVAVGISIGGVYGVTPFKTAIDLADKEMYKDKFRVTDK